MLLFAEIEHHVLNKLENGLSTALTYHNVAHTLDVLQQAVAIAKLENVTNEELFLLKVSALYHDVGFLNKYAGHEEASCVIAREELGYFGIDEERVDQVCGMIRATKVPQQPKTRLEEILCDADLDYLGRDDFFEIGKGLYKEFLTQKIVSNEMEWNKLQVNFLESHHYFTNTSEIRRKATKQMNLEKVKEKLV